MNRGGFAAETQSEVKTMVKKLLKSLREYKKDSILTPLLVVGEVVLECLIPFVISRLVDKIQAGCSVAETAKYGGLLAAMAVASLIFGWAAGVTASRASCGFAKNIRADIFHKVQDFSFQNIDRFSTSSLVTRMTTDVTNVQMAFMMIIRTAVRAPLMIIFSFTMAAVMGGRLALIFAVLLPLLGVVIAAVMRKVMPIFKRAFKKYDNLNGTVQENVRGMRVVKAFVREDYESRKFGKASDDLCVDFTKAERTLAVAMPFLQLCLYINMIAIMFFGSRFIINGVPGINVGQLSALITYGFQILSSLMMVAMIFVMIAMSGESASRIVEVLDEEPTIKNPENPIMSVPNGDIDFNNVSFRYSGKSDTDALSAVDLHIKSGETIGIIGGTGSSKSSLIQLIPRLYDVSAGSVSVGDNDVRKYDIEVLRDAVSIVLQKNELFSGTIKENLRWGNPNASDEELVEVCKMAAADEFISAFPDGYDTFIEQGGANVSGGQKQRLCIARALLKKPRVLILDDSTSAVDTRTDALIRKSLAEYLPDTTKIIIAQRTASVESADRIVIMDNGTINDVGTHKELLERNEIYKEVYYSQNKGGDGDEK